MAGRGVQRYNARRDHSEPEVIDALEAYGFSVIKISQRHKPDLVIAKNGITAVVEVKTGKARLHQEQESFWLRWAGNPRLVLRSADDVTVLAAKWAEKSREDAQGAPR